jgi:hypothetical protein
MQPRKAPQNANANIHAAVSPAPEAAQHRMIRTVNSRINRAASAGVKR